MTIYDSPASSILMERIVTQPKGSRDDADAFVDDRLTFGLRRASADVPQGWIMHEHPSGWLYFTHEILRIVTDDDIRDPALLASLENQISIMPPIPDKCEIQLHARFANRRFVNHDAALAGYSLKAVYGPQVDCLDAGALIRLRKLYWSFLQEHPCHAPLPPGAEDDVVESMTTFHTENVMFDNLSPSPFSDTEIEKLLDILQTHHALTTRPQSPSRTVFVAWLLRRIYGHRDAASHGRHTRKFFDELLLAKQAPPQSIQPSERLSLITKVCLGTLMSFFLWAVPYSYLQHLRNAMEYRGRLSDVQLRWEHYISKLVREWTDFNLVAAVLLSATVSFIAVPGINEVSLALALTSVVLSMGSMLIGMFCVWKHQSQQPVNNSFRYMHNVQSSVLGLRGVAILLSLPFVCLIWSAAAFYVSVVYYAFDQLSADGNGDPHTPLRTAASWAVAAVAITVAAAAAFAVRSFSRISEWRSSRMSSPLNLLRRLVPRRMRNYWY